MQKVVQRATSARKQAQKKIFRAKQALQVADRQNVLRVRKDYNKALVSGLKEARATRWEDWEKGPLAPMRHVGNQATTYGSVEVSLMHPPAIPKHLRRKQILFAVGDRVNEDSETVIINNINQAEINVPEFAKISMGIQSDTVTQSLPVSMNDVRHVIALEMGNETKDHIIQHVYAGPPFLERSAESKLPRFTRYVSGLDIEIPWPSESAPSIEVSECDTRGSEVTDVSWVPSMDEPPFPSTVIDELRNKYSRFRTRHDPEYVEKKVLEEYRQEYMKSQTLLTPRGEKKQATANASVAAKLAKLDADGNVIMDQETNDFISRFMGANAKKPTKSAKVQPSA
ncbi:hypothetical protein N7466_000093 [Penicillium verhagenii]|uniref:uncharacterized protein n=1 Tax=Penicillium verhagenii TaxID=1562060 RepID=UPI0025452324|nr:uncharacterized protein N7466_000093 [Penicillium verhagenii]KAJ5947078.1 hypothetical protein N7466_000093 [Penicillium verhagenii]